MTSFIYIHIPFCARKCIYCDFYSVADSEHLIDSYVRAICQEISMRKDELGPIESIYIGGGTPTLLEGRHFTDIMAAIKANASIADNAEITSESNPGTLTEPKVAAMLEAGINRLSIGIQSFKDEELRLLGRAHTAAEASKAFNMARLAGFANISLDLIYALPAQTKESWLETLSSAAQLRPEHISAYELTPEKGSPLTCMLDEGLLELPDEDIISDMFHATIETLTKAGYLHYEISNYSLNGFSCRHNLNYWNRGGYTGIGAAAHSFVNNQRFSNVADIGAYINAIEKDELPQLDNIQLDALDEIKETIFLGLRKREGFEMSSVAAEYQQAIEKTLSELVQQGHLELSAGRCCIKQGSLLLCNEIILRLLSDIDQHGS